MVQAYLLAQLLGSVLIVRVLKMTTGRARPDATSLPDFGSEWAGISWDAAHHSFPSGHTADIVTSDDVRVIAPGAGFSAGSMADKHVGTATPVVVSGRAPRLGPDG